MTQYDPIILVETIIAALNHLNATLKNNEAITTTTNQDKP